jgi:hypothetical protein
MCQKSCPQISAKLDADKHSSQKQHRGARYRTNCGIPEVVLHTLHLLAFRRRRPIAAFALWRESTGMKTLRQRSYDILGSANELST